MTTKLIKIDFKGTARSYDNLPGYNNILPAAVGVGVAAADLVTFDTAEATSIALSVTQAFGSVSGSLTWATQDYWGEPRGAWCGGFLTTNGGTGTVELSGPGLNNGDTYSLKIQAFRASTSGAVDVTVDGVTKTYPGTAADAPSDFLVFNGTVSGGKITTSVTKAAVGGAFYGILGTMILSVTSAGTPSRQITSLTGGNATSQHQVKTANVTGFTGPIASGTLGGVALLDVADNGDGTVSFRAPGSVPTGTASLVLSDGTGTGSLEVEHTQTHPLSAPSFPVDDPLSLFNEQGWEAEDNPVYWSAPDPLPEGLQFKAGFASWADVDASDPITTFLEGEPGFTGVVAIPLSRLYVGGATADWTVSVTVEDEVVKPLPSLDRFIPVLSSSEHQGDLVDGEPRVTLSPAQLLTFPNAAYFYFNAQNNMVFEGSRDGTFQFRSELRHYVPVTNEWSPSGSNVMSGTVTLSSSTLNEYTWAQVHRKDVVSVAPPLRLTWGKTRSHEGTTYNDHLFAVLRREALNTYERVPLGPRLDVPMDFEVRVIDGVLSIIINGAVVHTEPTTEWESYACYFKAGLYLTGSTAATGSASVEYSALGITNTEAEEPENDVTPDAFTFGSVFVAPGGGLVESAAITVAGVTPGVDIPISIAGGEYAVDAGAGFGAWTSAATTVQNGYDVKVRVSAAPLPGASAQATLTIGSVLGSFSVITLPEEGFSGNTGEYTSRDLLIIHRLNIASKLTKLDQVLYDLLARTASLNQRVEDLEEPS